MPDSHEVGRRSVPAFPRTLLEFQRLFPDEGACTAYLEAVRWPGGFVCHHCNWGVRALASQEAGDGASMRGMPS